MKRIAVVVLTLALATCDKGDPAAITGPGTLAARITGAQADDEAMVLDITGGVTGITATGSNVEIAVRQEGGTHIVAVFGALSVATLNIAVSDVGKQPAVTVREVAQSTGALRAVTTGYGVRIE